jgi:ABC-type uncharacterized transport system auxiliary subunit
MSIFDANLDRRDWIKAFAGAAVCLTVAGCQDQKKELTPQEIVASLTTETSLINSAQSHLKIEDVKVAAAIADDKSGVVKDLVKSYGMVLLLEEAEGSNRPLNSLLVRLASDPEKSRALREIQAIVSGCATDNLRSLEMSVHNAIADQSFLARWSSDSRHLGLVADSAEKLALKLETYPNFTFKIQRWRH